MISCVYGYAYGWSHRSMRMFVLKWYKTVKPIRASDNAAQSVTSRNHKCDNNTVNARRRHSARHYEASHETKS